MAKPTSSSSSFSSSSSSQFCSLFEQHQQELHQKQVLLIFKTMFLFLFFLFSLFLLCFLYILVSTRLRRRREEERKSTQTPIKLSLSLILDKTHQTHNTHRLFVEISNSKPSKWVPSVPPSHLPVEDVKDDRVSNGSELDKEGNLDGEDCGKNDDTQVKKKKKRAKKKKQSSQTEDYESQLPVLEEKNSLDSLYPFTSSSSVTQRKIKQQYDQLVKSHDSKTLTLAQVGQFANCLVEARNDLQHKSEIIQRKFTITKALLYKADRSSFDRLSQQIYKLEAEQKRLEEDAVVYNRLQEQLKISPAYKKMLEIGARVELEANSGHPVENTDTEFADISFEEFLAQEKKDSFWQRNRKLRSCTT